VIIIPHFILHAGLLKNSTFCGPRVLIKTIGKKVYVYLPFLLMIFYEFSTTFPLKNSNVSEAG